MAEKTQKSTILFVDDEPRWTLTYVEELRTCGYNVVFKENVDEARCYLKDNLAHITLLILDIMMPSGKEMRDEETRYGLRTGERFYDLVRQEISTDLPVFILTNVSDKRLEERFLQEPRCTFLSKEETPPHKLGEMVQIWCSNKGNKKGGPDESWH